MTTELYSVQIEYEGLSVPLPASPHLFGVQVEYGGNDVPLPASPKPLGVQVEYAGRVVPLSASPRPFSIQVEYQGFIVPLPAIPRILSRQIEYVTLPLTSGLVDENGDVRGLLSIASDGDTEVPSRVVPEDVLAIAEVSGNPLFDDADKWDYVVVQYLHDDSYTVLNIIHKLNGANFLGELAFFASSVQGSYRKRSIILRAKTGEELILLPTNFDDSDRIVIRP